MANFELVKYYVLSPIGCISMRDCTCNITAITTQYSLLASIFDFIHSILLSFDAHNEPYTHIFIEYGSPRKYC